MPCCSTGAAPLTAQMLSGGRPNMLSNRRRNYKDYFQFEEGNIRGGNPDRLSEQTQQEIREWLQQNGG